MYEAFTLCGPIFQSRSINYIVCNSLQNLQVLLRVPLNPMYATVAALHIHGLGFFPFARRYLGNLFWFIFLRLLRCFSSPGLASSTLCVQVAMIFVRKYRVSPFGYPRIYACLQLPVAFRRSLRPSSPASAKASTIRPLYLDLVFAQEKLSISQWIVPACFFPLCAVFKDPSINRVCFPKGYIRFIG